MVQGLRVYRPMPGRPLPDLLAHFENHTNNIWAKHGIRQVGFWTTLVGASSGDLTDIPAWEIVS